MEWISVKDKLPDEGVKVIGFFPSSNESGHYVDTAVTYDSKKLISDFPNSTAYCFKATHWMPLPNPPQL